MAESFGETTDVLYRTDTQLHTQTERVFSVAKRIVPSLAKVFVHPLDAHAQQTVRLSYVPRLNYEPGGRMTITFGTNLEEYQAFIDGYYADRLSRHKAFVAQHVPRLSAEHIVDICFAHELGHARQLDALQRKANVTTAHETFAARTKAEYASLPLGMPTSDVIEAWQSEKNGLRLWWEMQGHSEADLQLALEANTQAYEQLPLERDADNFAMRVIKEVYA